MVRFLTAGESHGRALVVILEGIPAGLPIDIDSITRDLKRRQGGYGRGATPVCICPTPWPIPLPKPMPA